MRALEVCGIVLAGLVVTLLAVAVALRLQVRRCQCGAGGTARGRLVVVTGANAGIGLQTARELAERGARVILACRSQEKAKAAKDYILRDVGTNADLDFLPLDLSDLASVRRAADQILRTEPRIDVLIHNAGVYGVGNSLTRDGIVQEMQVNHFAPFLLTLLLLPRLRARGRVVTVSSILHYFGTVNLPRINCPGFYSDLRTYCNSKLCNVLMTAELARRGVAAYCLHPGIVRTSLSSGLRLARPVFALWALLCRRDAREAAQTAVHLALSPHLASLSGRYFVDCAPAWTSPAARDTKLAADLWNYSENLIGYRYCPNEEELNTTTQSFEMP